MLETSDNLINVIIMIRFVMTGSCTFCLFACLSISVLHMCLSLCFSLALSFFVAFHSVRILSCFCRINALPPQLPLPWRLEPMLSALQTKCSVDCQSATVSCFLGLMTGIMWPLGLSRSFSVSLCISVSLSISQCLYISLCLSLLLYMSLFRSLYVSLCDSGSAFLCTLRIGVDRKQHKLVNSIA